MNHRQSLLRRKSVLSCQSLYICSRVHSGSLWSQFVQGSPPCETESVLRRKGSNSQSQKLHQKYRCRETLLQKKKTTKPQNQTPPHPTRLNPTQNTYILVGCLVFEAGNGHNIGPVIGLHGHAGCVRTGHVEGRGAVLVWALDAGTRHFLHPLPTVHTFLERNTAQRYSDRQRQL